MSDSPPRFESFAEVLDWLNGIERLSPHAETFHTAYVRDQRWTWVRDASGELTVRIELG
jgi:hypothetical protein